MKLGTICDGSRDGALAVVDTITGMALRVPEIAASLQSALDNWASTEAVLREVSGRLKSGACVNAEHIESIKWCSPLPRAYQLLDGGGYRPHLELGFAARGQELPREMTEKPGFYQSTSDSLLCPTDDIVFSEQSPGMFGVDFEAELAVITTDVPQGAPQEAAAAAIRLVGLMNDITLRTIQRVEFARGFGFFHAKPKKSFAPFMVTPDELHGYWRDHKLSLKVRVELNGSQFAAVDSGEDMLFDFATLVSEASRHRNLASGTIIGGGTIANRDRATRGMCCILERRIAEFIETGAEVTPYLQSGDRVRIEALLPDGHSVFGAIDQTYRVDV